MTVTSPDYVPLAVVVRFSKYEDADPCEMVVLKEAFDSHEEAEREVERLNALVKDKDHVQHFVLTARYFPEGRNVQTDY